MSNLRKSIHSSEHEFLRRLLKERREQLGLSQRALGKRMDVIYSFIGKVETGDRRLDVIEFVEYCKALNLDASDVIKQIQTEDFKSDK
ncbi:helix-turn-helix domain-containing protein [Psychrobacter sp. FDAARGOS_221]|uniref:helix-turn-helix domain-containing protein n=1 Tax=Psychrobacter sp. FDAARGOS_221 TaxID=1975705 RepID=UPI000BB53EB8|nr:helix-turn-helix transcriptional regulator [Psychrobacter sp. FDAARGOS_221]PNK61524.1 XRE family transcriptional regulator [Psychrobacter sp. FDAARGOS_221]